tara:strand:- start:556 stop:783 length:228 start_codon:yes stop_codon:yes gene_type:complete
VVCESGKVFVWGNVQLVSDDIEDFSSNNNNHPDDLDGDGTNTGPSKGRNLPEEGEGVVKYDVLVPTELTLPGTLV